MPIHTKLKAVEDQVLQMVARDVPDVSVLTLDIVSESLTVQVAFVFVGTTGRVHHQFEVASLTPHSRDGGLAYAVIVVMRENLRRHGLSSRHLKSLQDVLKSEHMLEAAVDGRSG